MQITATRFKRQYNCMYKTVLCLCWWYTENYKYKTIANW